MGIFMLYIMSSCVLSVLYFYCYHSNLTLDNELFILTLGKVKK